jgi:hypothetical protein
MMRSLSLRHRAADRCRRSPSALRRRRFLTPFCTSPVIFVVIVVFIPLTIAVEPAGQHPNLILFLYKFLQFGQFLE